MAFHIRDRETDALVRELARKRGTTLTEAVRAAAASELRRMGQDPSLHERLKKITEELAQYPDTGLKADKAFFDELSGD